MYKESHLFVSSQCDPSFSSPEEQARSLAETVSVDRTNHSVSFNEFLRLMSMQRDVEPDEETLLDMFR